jgi:fumarylacetoacetase
MSTELNETHDPALTSWVMSANAAGCDFPIQNLPFGVFREKHGSGPWRGGVAIGDQVLDLAAVGRDRLADPLADTALRAAQAATLNSFMALGRPAWAALRRALSRGLTQGAVERDRWQQALIAQADVEMGLPAEVGDYTDFYTSIHHATNVGRLFRPDNPLLPNYRWVPIGYHGRASSLGVSGESFRRPQGQTLPPGAEVPVFGPCRRLDHELELGLFIGPGNERGRPVPIDDAEERMFGICLLNDWSARDIQAWEYQPLGPFLSKNFATTLSPWIVTMEALAPYRAPFERTAGDPAPLPYLDGAADRARGAVDLMLEVQLQTQAMRERGEAAVRLTSTNFRRSAYWTLAQLVTHHTVNGCNLRPGDLFGTGTLSGPNTGQEGSMLELTRGGREPVRLPNREQRTFFEDGDTVVFRGWCERPGFARIGFGEVRSTVLAA